MTVIWSVRSLESRTADGAVSCAHYDAVLDEDRIYGSVSLTPEPTKSSFIPYAELTQEEVLGWVKEALGEEEVENIETDLAARAAEREAPVTTSGVPW